jgi:hypothetical protein
MVQISNQVIKSLKIRRSIGFSGSFLLVVMRRLFWRSLHPHSESKDLRHRLVSYLPLYYNISVLILFLASRGSYVSKIAKELVKPLRT